MNFVEQIVDFNKSILGIEQRALGLMPANEIQISIESLIEESNEFLEACNQKDFIKAVDAIADLSFFAVGVLYKSGMSENQICNLLSDKCLNRNPSVIGDIYELVVEVSDYIGFPEDDGAFNEIKDSFDFYTGKFSDFASHCDVVNSARAIANLIQFAFVIFGEFGISSYKARRIMSAVYTANMTKKLGVNAKRGDGVAADAVKPADFVPPEEMIEKILEMSETDKVS